MQRGVIIPVMVMRIGNTMSIVRAGSDQVDRAITHAAFGTNAVGKRSDGVSQASSHDRLELRLMIKNDVRRCRHKVMMIVLQRQQPFRQRPNPEIIDIRQAGYAMRTSIGIGIMTRRSTVRRDDEFLSAGF